MLSLYTKNIDGVWFGVALDGEAVFASTFASGEERAFQYLLANIPFNESFQTLEKPLEYADQVLAIMKIIHDGKDVSHALSLSTKRLPDYTRKVLEATCLIPTGYASSYGLIAEAVGGGARAVGNIMASNPFPPIVPCHRVVRSDLTLGGYGGGLEAKFAFLRREKRDFASKQEIPVNGKKLTVFPVELVLKKMKKQK